MRFTLIAAALAIAVPASADAQRMDGSGLSAGQGTQGRGTVRPIPDFERPRARDDRDDRRDDRRDGRRRGYPIGFGYYGGYGGRDIDRSWQPDSFNDWWHERPWRAYPAWVSRNQNCERVYWSGGAWRC